MMSARIKQLRLGALASIMALVVTSSCYEEEKLNVPVKQTPITDDPIDLYVQENFIEKYGVAVRYKYVDRYVDPTKRVVPPRRELVIPMLDFLTELWIEPWVEVPNGEKFFKKHVPAEMVFIGSPIFNDDGTVTLGTADAGARITLTEVNDINITNQAWVFRQLGTIYHEFAHIVHQRYNLPPGWENISPQGYTSAGSWYNLSDEEALQRGFTSPYATSSFNEDFAEFVAFLLFEPDFYEIYYDDEVCNGDADCIERNEGRALLRKKYTAILAHYKQHTGVELLKVRDLIQAKL
jgi:substrate import-associated zinc metallohydrolase lipoprotein